MAILCAAYQILLSVFLIPIHGFFGSLGLEPLQDIIEGFDDIVTSVLIC